MFGDSRYLIICITHPLLYHVSYFKSKNLKFCLKENVIQMNGSSDFDDAWKS